MLLTSLLVMVLSWAQGRNGDLAFIPPPPALASFLRRVSTAKHSDLDALLHSPTLKDIVTYARGFVCSFILWTWWFHPRRVCSHHVRMNYYVAGIALVSYHGQPEPGERQ